MKRVGYIPFMILLLFTVLTACSAGGAGQQKSVVQEQASVQQSSVTLESSAGNNTASPDPSANSAATSSSADSASTAVASTTGSSGNNSTAAGEKVFTKEELAKYNGQNGNPAYIAIDGVVYDVSAVPQWRNGRHKGGYQAGMDLTESFKTASPHNSGILSGIPVAGKYAG